MFCPHEQCYICFLSVKKKWKFTYENLSLLYLQNVTVHVVRVSEAQLSVVASVLLTSGLMKLIAESDNEPGLKQQAYLTAGQLVVKVPSLVNKDLSLLQTLFMVLCQVCFVCHWSYLFFKMLNTDSNLCGLYSSQVEVL